MNTCAEGPLVAAMRGGLGVLSRAEPAVHSVATGQPSFVYYPASRGRRAGQR